MVLRPVEREATVSLNAGFTQTFKSTIKLNHAPIGRRHGNDTHCHDVGQYARCNLIVVLNFIGEYDPPGIYVIKLAAV